MTDKLHCPFCGAELKRSVFMIASCPNENCKIPECKLPIYIWDALMDGKKAQDALNYARNRLDLFANKAYGLKRPTIKTVERLANEALEKITSITKQEK